MSWSLRPVADADRELILSLYAVTRAGELAQVPWTEAQKQAFLQHQVAAQERHYWERYPTSQHQVILTGERPMGRLWLDRQPDRIHILDLTLLPAARGAGVGTALLRNLQAEATAVTIYLESFSPSLPFFERLGFAREEERGAHLLLAWRGAASFSDKPRLPSHDRGSLDGPALRR
jgi:ribosomal protein S18 acetylase RimI-like enzyme